MSDPETLKVYAGKVAEYTALSADAATSDPLLARFISALPQGGAVLDLGCGPGLGAAEMARAGLQVVATDAVPEMVAAAALHAGVNARHATFEDLTETAAYDGVWANFSLLHAPRVAMPAHLLAIHRALRPGGLCHLALKAGSGSKRDGLGRLYTYYEEAELTKLMQTAGFTVTASDRGREVGLDGVPADWIALFAHA